MGNGIMISQRDRTAADFMDGLQAAQDDLRPLFGLSLCLFVGQHGKCRFANAGNRRITPHGLPESICRLTQQLLREFRTIRCYNRPVGRIIKQQNAVAALLQGFLLIIGKECIKPAAHIHESRHRIDIRRIRNLLYAFFHLVRIKEYAHESDNLSTVIERPFVAGDMMQHAAKDALTRLIPHGNALCQNLKLGITVRTILDVPAHILIRLAKDVLQ